MNLHIDALLQGLPATVFSAFATWWAKKAHDQVKPAPPPENGDPTTLRQDVGALAVTMGEHLGDDDRRFAALFRHLNLRDPAKDRRAYRTPR